PKAGRQSACSATSPASPTFKLLSPEALENASESSLKVGLAGGVALHADCLPALGGDGIRTSVSVLLSPPGDRDGCSGLGQAFGHGASEHTAAADHNRDFAIQRKE